MTLRDRLIAAGHKVFAASVADMNLVAERNPVRSREKHVDVMHLLRIGPTGEWVDEHWPCTIEPGLPFLTNPINPKGTAGLTDGHHAGLWTLGYHKGRPALVQASPAAVARDGDKDGVYEPGLLDVGMFGINCHSGGPGASAGCVVMDQAHVDILRLALLFQQQMQPGATKVSLTIIPME